MQGNDDSMTVRLAAFEPRSLANGPGVRAVLWVQGCGRRCPGCFNPEFLPREGGRLVAVAEVVAQIEAARVGAGCQYRAQAAGRPFEEARAAPGPGTGTPGLLGNAGAVLAPRAYLEGITFSGGEPFDQAGALAAVARGAQGLGLGVLIFTGYPWCELRDGAGPGWAELLAAADLLVAGPYEQDRPGAQPLLASANQELVHITERYREAVGQAGGRRTEFRIGADGTVRVTGFPAAGAGARRQEG